MYHRKWICFHQLLTATRRRRKITNLPVWACAPLSINQATLSARPFQSTKQLWACAPFNQLSNFERAHPFQSVRQKFYHLHTSTESFPPTPHGLGPPSSTCPNSWSTLLPSHQGQRNPHTPPPLLSMISSDVASWPRYGHPVISQRRSDWNQDHNGCYFSSWNDLIVKKSASKSSAVSEQEGGILYWPACWVAYKRKPGRAQFSVCSQWSTPPHPWWTQPELHHLDTVCWIST